MDALRAALDAYEPRGAQDAADLQRVDRILDFGCAVGRVLRSLRAGFPEATITACEIRKHDVEWCRKTFGPEKVVAVQSAREPEDVRLDGPFDVIWAGSILTHIDRERWTRFLEPLPDRLRDESLPGLRSVAMRARAAYGPKDSIRDALPPDVTEPFLDAIDRLVREINRFQARGSERP